MAESQKYFYMRLKEDFFDSEEMVLLESLPDGLLYQNILLKMYCRSIKSGGRLMFNNVIPYNANMLAKITRMQVGTVEKALEIFQQMGLIEVLDNGAIYMMNIQDFIGKSSTDADRKRNYRKQIEEEKKKIIEIEDKCPDECPDKSPDKSPTNLHHIRDREELEREYINTHADFQSAIESEFELLWKAYPNKQGKANALKAYTKARKDKKHPVSFETVKYAVETYAKEMRDTETKYIKHGSTWFNQQCWCDYEAKREAEESIRNNPNIDPYSGGSTEF